MLVCCTPVCSVLDKIKCNLRKEQRTVMELNFVTMHRILSPIQVCMEQRYECLVLASECCNQVCHWSASANRLGINSAASQIKSLSATSWLSCIFPPLFWSH